MILDFAGLPLSPTTFFPPEREFEVLRQAQQAYQQTLGEGLLFNPHSEAMLSCLTKGWLHLEETGEGEFKCYFPTLFHNRSAMCYVFKSDMHTNNIPGSWSTSREFRIFDIPLRLH